MLTPPAPAGVPVNSSSPVEELLVIMLWCTFTFSCWQYGSCVFVIALFWHDPGAIVELCLNSGRKAIRFQAVIRNASAQEASFEIVDIEFEERTKLRKLLLQSGKALQQDGSAPLRQMEQQTAEIAS